MSRRNSKDELLRFFLDNYRLNLLALPREKGDVGDAYAETPGGLSTPGNLRYLLTPEIVMPQIVRDERLADIDGKKSAALDIDAAFNLLEGFLAALGVSQWIGKIKAEYQNKRTRSLRFAFKAPLRDSVDAFAFGKALAHCHLDPQQPFVRPDIRYYVTVGVVRSASITVSAEDDNSNAVSLEAEALKAVVGGSAKINFKDEGSGTLTYEGSVPLAFGLELLEMTFDEQEQKFHLSALPDPHLLQLDKPRIRTDFIGDEQDGNAFVKIMN